MIAITGIGVITAYGRGEERLWSGLKAGKTAIKGVLAEGADRPVALAQERVCTSQLAIGAALHALNGGSPDGLGVIGATTSGDMSLGERAFAELKSSGAPREAAHLLFRQLCHQPTQRVARALKATGPSLTVSTACTSGAVALGIGASWIRSGRVDRVLVFGADALCLTTSFGFASLGVQSASPCRPFDVNRDGMSLGEGAGALLLERLPAGARPRWGWLVGEGNTTDAHHLTAPDPAGTQATRAIRQALGRLGPAQVGFVCAHATGTRLNDAMESLALSNTVPSARWSGLKGAIGHTLGAAGTIEVILALLALRHQVAPPTIGFTEAAEPLPVSAVEVPLHTDYALSVNFAFGGHNAAILVKR